MQYSNLVTDKTYFFMQDGEIKTYFKTNVTNGTLEILVYDRTSVTGTAPLKIKKVKDIIDVYSNEFEEGIKALLSYIKLDLCNGNRQDLYKFICAIWNEDSETADDLQFEDCTLVEQFISYMDKLSTTNILDSKIVNYFKQIICEQELIYPKYSEKWLYNFLSQISKLD